MSRKITSPAVYIHHWRWLRDNGYKKEAASCKRQALQLTRQQYKSMISYTVKEKEL